jgi:hypothetical protein
VIGQDEADASKSVVRVEHQFALLMDELLIESVLVYGMGRFLSQSADSPE